MERKTSKGAKGLLLAFLLLYAFITLTPAAVHQFFIRRADAAPSASPMPGSPEPSPEASPDAAPKDFLDARSLPQGGGPIKKEAPKEASFTLYDAATGETLTVPEEEFLAAALACEMDLAAPKEALKAQAVASYSYYSRLRDQGEQIACDTENWLVYVPQSAMEARWGEDCQSYRALLEGVVAEVKGQLLTYEGKPALACYFAISPGSTESAENVWAADAGAEHPYLQAAASPGDLFCDGYLSTASFTEEEFRAAVEAYFAGETATPDLSGPAEEWLTELEYTPSRMVKSAELGGLAVTGAQIRGALGLRSASFDFTLEEGSFRFTVRGWGHGVGMSQAGAVFLAQRGADYREILAHYYPGTTLLPPAA
ncbi:SpoIID/LytB domain-containing protein [Acutalibacter sp. 1XD8-33]|uniref:SpoIID/LytB domain-containing protein n=1 Tax=Acutalibacter sp. 1XD8-33 TaxID=2320081 RepID=UPI001314170E|nr:SpoIID/LytB domain-containing protein [Acutalibacter sp. 1XD8-33]